MDEPKNTVDKRLTPGFMAQAGKGRPKGVPNKATTLAKDAIADAFEKLGGAERLVAWAKEDPDNEKVFYTALLPKLIPVQTEITGKDGAAIQYEQKVTEDANAFRSRLLSGLASAAAASGTGETVQ